MKRKTFLHNSAALLGVGLLPSLGLHAETKKKSVRFAHLTDIHGSTKRTMMNYQ